MILDILKSLFAQFFTSSSLTGARRVSKMIDKSDFVVRITSDFVVALLVIPHLCSVRLNNSNYGHVCKDFPMMIW